jgi:hypothetical protein
MPLRIAAKVDDKDREYYETVVKPLIAKGGDIEFVGEIDDAHKAEFLGGALALLCPIDWPEPFGLVLIEAAACGTPSSHGRAARCRRSSATASAGHRSSEEEAVKALADVERIDRAACRREFEERFTAQRMARDYLHVYRRMLDSAGISPSAAMRQVGVRHERPPDEAIRIEDRWYVLATSARAGDPTRVLKHGESFALFDRYGDMPRAGGGEHGLYHQGTRFLSRYELRLNGQRPLPPQLERAARQLRAHRRRHQPRRLRKRRAHHPQGHGAPVALLDPVGAACHERLVIGNYGATR